jgi:uncharacterized RDD family membrane protein YckC
MVTNGENVSKLLSILSNKLRRDILFLINEKKELSFSDLMNSLDIDTGKLSFHLRNLKMFIEQTSSGRYTLSDLGKNSLRVIGDVETLSLDFDLSKKKSIFNIAKFSRRLFAFIIDIGVVFTLTMTVTLVAHFSFLFSGQYFLDLNIFLFLGFLWVYSTLMEGFSGQTLGKLIFRLKVKSVSGKKLYYDNAAVRNFGKCFLLPIDLMFGYNLKDVRFLKYFDKFSGTTVIQY